LRLKTIPKSELVLGSTTSSNSSSTAAAPHAIVDTLFANYDSMAMLQQMECEYLGTNEDYMKGDVTTSSVEQEDFMSMF
jgi:hypothetical protein